MTRDLIQDEARRAPEPRGSGGTVLAGVMGAIVLGVALGMWARPGETVAAAPPAVRPKVPAPAPVPALRIIVDESPAPIGQPLEVLSPEPASPAVIGPLRAPPPMPAPEPVVPRRPASGLVRVDAPVAVELPPAPAPVHVAPKAKVVVAAKPKPDPAKTRVAEARPAKQEREKAIKPTKAEIKLAKIEKAERIEKAAKVEKARTVKLAKAEKARAQKAVVVKAKVEAKPKRLATLVKKVKAEARQIVKPKAMKVAVIKPAPKLAPPPAKPARKAAAKPPVLRGSGPLRFARADGCGSSDPGAAIVCADGRLGARDRQLQEAYRTAEAAGVPASALRRQQDRWLQARAAAAREAPWAVEDVYVARISELKDQTRDAREN